MDGTPLQNVSLMHGNHDRFDRTASHLQATQDEVFTHRIVRGFFHLYVERVFFDFRETIIDRSAVVNDFYRQRAIDHGA